MCVAVCVAVWCSVVQSDAVCCSVLQCVAACCSVCCRQMLNMGRNGSLVTQVRYSVAMCVASALQCGAAWCSERDADAQHGRRRTRGHTVLWCVAVCCSVVLCGAVWCRSSTCAAKSPWWRRYETACCSVCCGALQCVLQCVLRNVWCSVVQCIDMRQCVAVYVAVRCGVI